LHLNGFWNLDFGFWILDFIGLSHFLPQARTIVEAKRTLDGVRVSIIFRLIVNYSRFFAID
jgi:hypothetical protein